MRIRQHSNVGEQPADRASADAGPVAGRSARPGLPLLATVGVAAVLSACGPSEREPQTRLLVREQRASRCTPRDRSAICNCAAAVTSSSTAR